MRILLDILHPKHVHFFRPLITRWLRRGDAVFIVTRDKDITHQLLDTYGFPYVCISKQERSYRLAGELVKRWYRILDQLLEFSPDITLSVGGISTAMPAKLLGIPNIILTDTETASLSNALAFPFADRILTPAWYRKEIGPQQVRYRGFHEWSYLHPAEFTPDPQIVWAEGINPEEPYALVRLVRWDAVHDLGETGLGEFATVELVKRLADRMRVYISSETALPEPLQPFLATFNVSRIHHILAYARLLVGESPSMGTEAALLGVPSVIISSWAGRCGNMQVLEQQYGLMRVYQHHQEALEAVFELADRGWLFEAFQAKRTVLVRDLECIPDVVDRQIEQVLDAAYD